MAHTAFFAWQLDTPAEQNKKFIWNALVSATNTTASSAVPEESPRPESDTLGVAGSPNVVDTIFNRIREGAFFVADLTFTSKKDTSVQEINECIRKAKSGTMDKVLGYTEEELVSIDFNGNPHSSIFDATQTKVVAGKMCRVVSWYDNEWGFSNRMLDVAETFGKI